LCIWAAGNGTCGQTVWFFSDELYKLFNIEPGTIIGKGDTYLSYIHPDDRKKVRQGINRAIKYGDPFSYDVRLVLPGLPLKYVHSEGQASKDKSGKVVRLIGAILDITESKLLDAARSDFVAMASHQLRTPATSVKQYTGLLLGGIAGKLSPGQTELLQTAYESNERQITIVLPKTPEHRQLHTHKNIADGDNC
jgi:PAS fold/His Kinase A (phospho-acceptor) domain